MKMLNWTIGRRLGAGFGLIIGVMIAITAIGAVYLYRTSTSVDILVNQRFPQSVLVNTIKSDFNDLMTNAGKVPELVSIDRQDAWAELLLVQQSAGFITENITRLEQAAFLMPDEQQGIAELKIVYANFMRALAMFVDVVNKADASHDVVLPADLQGFGTSLVQSLDFLSRQYAEQAIAEGRHAGETVKSALLLMLVLAGVGTVVGTGIGVLITRTITRPIKEAVNLATQVAAGNLTTQISAVSRDETGMLMLSLQKMNDSLMRIVGQVRQGASTIEMASTEIVSGTFSLSGRTEQQAKALGQAVVSIAKLNSTVKQTADNAGLANEQVKIAADNALRGGTVVSRVVETMELIKMSSQRIADIIGVVDSIAFQTNILALNAAVEAALAGDQGRGFAVVASEVRRLAQRSAEASKEIKVLIDESVLNVDAGSTLVDTAGKTMDEIVSSVQRVAQLMSEITDASRDQSTEIDSVSITIHQMDKMTRQNVTMVEEATGASEELKSQAADLARAVSVFRIDTSVEHAVGTVDTTPALFSANDVAAMVIQSGSKAQRTAFHAIG
ncbi:MAG TPA: methyl-accepting chemotaxis protein [Candidimonas sp.]|nr:methyl-accepting chemotaxis protein [Candidimonas sp.]